MKMIIVFPDGLKKEFNYSDFAEFHHWLFAVLSGIPKRVEICTDKDYNEIYHVSYF